MSRVWEGGEYGVEEDGLISLVAVRTQLPESLRLAGLRELIGLLGLSR